MYELKKFKVIKFPRLMQSFMYFLGVEREKVCEPKSNKFFWKVAKNELNDSFLQRMGEYWCLGPKDNSYLGY